MSKKILFSPVGGTDPIRDCNDGSMLHICRHYKPDVVYLYLTHEMLEKHRNDNRYVATINLLGEFLHHKFDVKLIERDTLIEAQQYDIFYDDFKKQIQEIEAEMDAQDTLILNLASGTPAMKSALNVMSVLAEYRFIPIQVSTPKKGINKTNGDRNEWEKYDVMTNWELNEDNEEGAKNRCKEIKCQNLMNQLKADMIKKHIEVYNYDAAYNLANEIREDLSEETYNLIYIALLRSKLNIKEISKIDSEQKSRIFPVKEGNKQKIFEYALVLQLKLKKNEYVDFIRGITPLVLDIFIRILKKECGLDIDKLTKPKKGLAVREWDMQKLEKEGLLDLLDREYNGKFRGGIVYSHAIAKIISAKSNNSDLCEKVSQMSEIEKGARNPAAHEMVSASEEWFVDTTGKSVTEIFNLIKYLMSQSGIEIKKEMWDSYDEMNTIILNSMF